MAVAKKKVTKKTTAKAAVKAPVKKVKKPVSKVASKKRVSKKSSSKSDIKSFHVATNTPPFRTFRVTRQTLYWVVLVAFIVFAQLWIIKLQVDIGSLLDSQQTQITTN